MAPYFNFSLIIALLHIEFFYPVHLIAKIGSPLSAKHQIPYEYLLNLVFPDPGNRYPDPEESPQGFLLTTDPDALFSHQNGPPQLAPRRDSREKSGKRA